MDELCRTVHLHTGKVSSKKGSSRDEHGIPILLVGTYLVIEVGLWLLRLRSIYFHLDTCYSMLISETTSVTYRLAICISSMMMIKGVCGYRAAIYSHLHNTFFKGLTLFPRVCGRI